MPMIWTWWGCTRLKTTRRISGQQDIVYEDWERSYANFDWSKPWDVCNRTYSRGVTGWNLYISWGFSYVQPWHVRIRCTYRNLTGLIFTLEVLLFKSTMSASVDVYWEFKVHTGLFRQIRMCITLPCQYKECTL